MSMMRCRCGQVVNTDDDPEGFYRGKPYEYVCQWCDCNDEEEDDDLHTDAD